MRFNLFTPAMTRSINMAMLKVKANSPKILFGVGCVGVATGTALACRATLKAAKDVKNLQDNLEKVRETKDTNPNYGKELCWTYVKGIGHITKHYIFPVGVIGGSMYCFGKGQSILTSRLASESALSAAALNAYNTVVSRMSPEEKERLVDGVSRVPYEVTEIDENGKKKKKKDFCLISGDDYGHVYARWFNKDNSNWDEDPMLSKDFIMKQQAEANRLLEKKGHLFLNEVYQLLKMPLAYPYGNEVGWIWEEEEPNKISFGLFEEWTSDINKRFVNGDEQDCLLEFNVDGKIIDKL